MSDPAPTPCTEPRRILRRLAPAVLLLAVAACGLFGRQPGEAGPGSDEKPGITVEVRNLAWKNIHVYAISGASWTSLGVLSSQGEETYELPRGFVGGRQEIRLAADPVGSNQAFISDPIQVEPDDVVGWTIQDNLALSSVFVR